MPDYVYSKNSKMPISPGEGKSAETTDINHFNSIPWCIPHLSHPDLIVETPSSRFPKPTQEDELFARTLHNPKAISHFLIFHPRPTPSDTLIPELRSFVTLNTGINGFPGVAHGGIVISLLDEVCGLLFPTNKAHGLVPDVEYMTGYLNTNFLSPVKTPGTFLVTGRIARVEGRKFFIDGVVEDEKGEVLAKADMLYIARKSKL